MFVGEGLRLLFGEAALGQTFDEPMHVEGNGLGGPVLSHPPGALLERLQRPLIRASAPRPSQKPSCATAALKSSTQTRAASSPA